MFDITPEGRAILASRRQGLLARGTQRRQFSVVLNYCPDAIVIADADGLVSEWNPAAGLMFGTPRSAALGAPVRDVLFAQHGEHFETAWQRLLAGESAPRFEFQPSKRSGREQRIGAIVAPIRSGGALSGAVIILRDLTATNTMDVFTPVQERAPQGSQTEAALADTERDGPAGLLGRRWLQQHLSEPPVAGMGRGVAVFDIDVFTIVNTTYGPDAADDVLFEFAELLGTLDTPGVFAHLREDVFVWIVDSADPVGPLNDCVAALTSALQAPFVVADDEVWLTLSFGLATTTLAMDGDLLGAARDALDSARREGSASAVYYNQAMAAGSSSGFRLANDLHRAIDDGELRLHYQPIMEIATNEIAGAEALVRWERPGVGLLAPDSFIDAAERTGQIVPLGNWVARTACENAHRLGSYSGGLRTMSINISARQLRDPGLAETLREAMADGKTPPSTIIVEVTESVLVNDLDRVAASLSEIKALDVGLDLDDFGTGYSSLQYLRNLPIDRLKVDQSFVAGLGVNTADTAIVASTIALAHALGHQSVAEGVETPEQLALLRELGCDFAQGYLLSRPADIETFTTWLDAYVPADIPPTPAAILQERSDAADIREVAADGRDTRAATRDSTADSRDTRAATRDTKATARDTTADTRDAIAAERDAAADDREGKDGPTRKPESRGDSDAARRAAKHDRSLATADRLIDEKDRARAGHSRDDASAERASEASARAEEQADLPDE